SAIGWFDEINRKLDELDLAGPVIGPIFLAAGFWVTPSTPLWLLFEIKRLHEVGELSPETLQRLIVETYRHDDYALLQAIVRDWEDNPLFVSRREILLDALDAHIHGKYTLTIPALLAQIESIACEICQAPHGSPGRTVRQAANGVDMRFVAALSR